MKKILNWIIESGFISFIISMAVCLFILHMMGFNVYVQRVEVGVAWMCMMAISGFVWLVIDIISHA